MLVDYVNFYFIFIFVFYFSPSLFLYIEKPILSTYFEPAKILCI